MVEELVHQAVGIEALVNARSSYLQVDGRVAALRCKGKEPAAAGMHVDGRRESACILLNEATPGCVSKAQFAMMLLVGEMRRDAIEMRAKKGLQSLVHGSTARLTSRKATRSHQTKWKNDKETASAR